MRRKRKSAADPMMEPFSFRMTEAEGDILSDFADAHRMTLSEVIRAAVLAYIAQPQHTDTANLARPTIRLDVAS